MGPKHPQTAEKTALKMKRNEKEPASMPSAKWRPASGDCWGLDHGAQFMGLILDSQTGTFRVGHPGLPSSSVGKCLKNCLKTSCIHLNPFNPSSFHIIPTSYLAMLPHLPTKLLQRVPDAWSLCAKERREASAESAWHWTKANDQPQRLQPGWNPAIPSLRYIKPLKIHRYLPYQIGV